MPGFLANIEAIKANGVDKVACISVNDAFVMGAWGKDLNVGDRILMLGDGNGEFTEAMGLTNDGSKNGMGMRSRRYAMVVEGGIIKQLYIEEPGVFEVSSAENVLKHL